MIALVQNNGEYSSLLVLEIVKYAALFCFFAFI